LFYILFVHSIRHNINPRKKFIIHYPPIRHAHSALIVRILAKPLLHDILAGRARARQRLLIRQPPCLPAAPPLAHNRRDNPQQPHEGRDDGVGGDLALVGPEAGEGRGVGREQQAEPAVDDAERDDDATEPDVCVGPEGAARVLLELHVVDEAEKRLEEEECEDEDADDGVGVRQEVDGQVLHHPHAEAEGGCVDDVGDELEDAVDEPRAAEGAQADEDGADGEEEDEG
jgi:hypothetical protein